ncbi:MAG: hypothetical protein H6717_25830 [Polyangiaceae bacterium]|nr:hypothetical protein [Polyangiaceae bacterium]
MPGPAASTAAATAASAARPQAAAAAASAALGHRRRGGSTAGVGGSAGAGGMAGSAGTGGLAGSGGTGATGGTAGTGATGGTAGTGGLAALRARAGSAAPRAPAQPAAPRRHWRGSAAPRAPGGLGGSGGLAGSGGTGGAGGCPGAVVNGTCVYAASLDGLSKTAAQSACTGLGAGWDLCPSTIICDDQTKTYLGVAGCDCNGGATQCACGTTNNLYVHTSSGTAPYYIRTNLVPNCDWGSDACTSSVSESCGIPLCCN